MKPFKLSTYQRIWTKTQLTDMVRTLLNCIGEGFFSFYCVPEKLVMSTVFSLKQTSLQYRLPVPRPGQVLGLVGTNGIGKSTALKVLAGKLKPNLGRFNVILKLCLSLLPLDMENFLNCHLSFIFLFFLCRTLLTGKKF